MTRDEYVEFIKTTALSIAKKAVMDRLAVAIPLLSTNFFGGIVGLMVGKVLEIAIRETEFAAFFLYIDLRVDAQGVDFEKAALAWYNASPEEKEKYEKDYLEKFYALASLRS